MLLFSLQVLFTYRLAFRRSSGGHFCDQTTISQGTLIGQGSWAATCTDASSANCYSRTVANGLYPCTDFSAIEDWSMGESSFNYTFPSADEEWSVRYVLLCSDDLSNRKIALQIKPSDNFSAFNFRLFNFGKIRRGSRILKWGVNFCNNVIEPKPG